MTQSEAGPVPEAVMRLWNRLAFRFGIGLAVAGALTLAGSAWLNLHLQQDHTLGLMQSRADQLVGVVMSITRDAMLANDKAELGHLIGAIGRQRDFRRMRLIDRSGRVQYSDVGTDVGSILDPADPSCIACHTQTPPSAGESPPMERVRVLDPPGGGERVLEVFAAVPNLPQCSQASCHAHPVEQPVLGVLEARLSLAGMQNDLAASSRELAVALFVGVLAIVLIVGAFTWRWVLQPVGELTVASDRLAAGDLGVRVPVRARDEIGALGNAWNHMADELAEARADLQKWGATLEERVEQKTAELQQAQEQMLRVERMASLGALSAEVAHEINNPLAGIAMYARLMRRKLGYDSGTSPDHVDSEEPRTGAVDTAELANVLAMIDDESRRCGKIVRNLLLFSRTPTAQVTDVDLGAVLQRCCMLVGHKAKLDGIAIDTEIDPGTPVIQGDPAQIEQMLLGLVMNSIEACAADDSVTVAVTAGRQPGGVRLSVRDSGRGIPACQRDKIFEPFFSTKTESSGIGLGLSVVYGIVLRHGGTIEVRSEEGVGTDMLIELPAHPPVDAEEERTTAADQVFTQRNSPARLPDTEEP